MFGKGFLGNRLNPGIVDIRHASCPPHTTRKYRCNSLVTMSLVDAPVSLLSRLSSMLSETFPRVVFFFRRTERGLKHLLKLQNIVTRPFTPALSRCGRGLPKAGKGPASMKARRGVSL